MYLRFLFQASFIFLWLLCSLNNNYAQQPELGQYPRSHFVKVSSLLPPTFCNRNSTKVPNKVSLEVVSKYGPCSALKKGKAKTPSYSEILRKDRSRINFIKSRISESKNLKQTLGISVPAKTKASFGDYYAIVSLGAPQQDVSLVLDTGSGITWTQCKPCTKHCFKQSYPLFDPARSKSTYSNVPCGSSTCKQLASVGQDAGCISNKCAYQSVYGDNTYTIGFLSTDKFTLTNGASTLVINGYNFGCGINNSAAAGDAQALGGASGILGLDRSPFSFISQMPASFNKYFSYCLSSSGSSPGYITFGKTAEDIKNKHLKFTPLTNVPQTPEFYGIVVTGISVDGKKLSVRDSAYTESSAIIDSGTTLTTLPKKVYSALKSAFRKQMLKHNKMKPISGTDDLCYDFSKVDSVNIPAISIFLKGGIELELDVLGILYGSDVRNMCLGFSANDDKNDPLILGNVQQRGKDVQYDVANGKLGIAPGGCAS